MCGRGIVADHATGAGGVAAYAAPACGENGERRDGDERVPSCGNNMLGNDARKCQTDISKGC